MTYVNYDVMYVIYDVYGILFFWLTLYDSVQVKT